ncbi:LOW QUALITY PROTEIN: hypothetical protein RJ639_027488, partial [Escallonia herrerae]
LALVPFAAVNHLLERIVKMALQKANFSKSSCCICHSIKRLLYEHGLSPTIVELDENPTGREMELAIVRLIGCSPICASRVQWGKFSRGC